MKKYQRKWKENQLFFKFLCWVSKEIWKNIFFNINISWTNACCLLIFWWNTTLDKLKSLNQNFLSVLHFFMMLAILIYVKKLVKYVWFLEKIRTNYFLGIILLQALFQILKIIAWIFLKSWRQYHAQSLRN